MSSEIRRYEPRPLVFTDFDDLNFFAAMEGIYGLDEQEAFEQAIAFRNLIRIARANNLAVEAFREQDMIRKPFAKLRHHYNGINETFFIDTLEPVSIRFSDKVRLLGMTSIVFAKKPEFVDDEFSERTQIHEQSSIAFEYFAQRADAELNGWRMQLRDTVGGQITLDQIGDLGEEAAA